MANEPDLRPPQLLTAAMFVILASVTVATPPHPLLPGFAWVVGSVASGPLAGWGFAISDGTLVGSLHLLVPLTGSMGALGAWHWRTGNGVVLAVLTVWWWTWGYMFAVAPRI